MTRRFIVGNAGAGFTMRQAKPGYDAAGAPLDGLNFDADYYPGRILGSGSAQIPVTNRPNLSTAVGVTNIAHGLGKSPDIVLGLAQPLNNTTFAPEAWEVLNYVPEVNSTQWTIGTLGNSNMDFRFCSPFKFEGNNKGGPFQSGQG